MDTKTQETRDYGPPMRMKDPRKAMLLAAVPGLFGIAGLGHIYAGRRMRGMLLMAVYLASVLYMVVSFVSFGNQSGFFGIVVVIVIWAAQVKGAHDSAVLYNQAFSEDTVDRPSP